MDADKNCVSIVIRKGITQHMKEHQKTHIEGLHATPSPRWRIILFVVAVLVCAGGYWYAYELTQEAREFLRTSQATDAACAVLPQPKGASWRELSLSRHKEMTTSIQALQEELFQDDTVDSFTPLAAKEHLEFRTSECRKLYADTMPLPVTFGIPEGLPEETTVREWLLRTRAVEAFLAGLAKHDCTRVSYLTSTAITQNGDVTAIDIGCDAVLPARSVPHFLAMLQHPGEMVSLRRMGLLRYDGISATYRTRLTATVHFQVDDVAEVTP